MTEPSAGRARPPESPESPVGRDHYVIDAAESRCQRFHRPLRGALAYVLRTAELLALQWLPRWAGPRRVARLVHQRRFARRVGGVGIQSYLPDQSYVELQIGKETRPVLVLAAGASVDVPCTPDPASDLIFGAAPIIDEHEWSGGTWGWGVSCGEAGRQTPQVTRVPCAGRDDNFVYFPGDGWIDVKLSLDGRAGQPSRIVLTNPPSGPDGQTPPLAISAPQILRRRAPADRRCVLVLSVESLSDPAFLRQRYESVETPCLDAFAREATTYPLVYSTVDSTLPFAGSMFTGLLPSQHAIGNYGVGADTFDNQIVNRRLTLLQETMKAEQFVTFAAAGANRLSGKLGWTRGFDTFVHDFHKWSSDASVDFDCLPRAFQKFRDYDTFAFAHIDYLHEPLVCPGAAQGQGLLYPQSALSAAGTDMSPEIFFEQLALVDRRIGQLVQWLKDSGSYDNTGIILTGDHGCGLNWVKHSEYSLYDERLRVPLMVKPPRWAVAERPVAPVASSIPEIFQTLHSWLGVPINSSVASLAQYRPDQQGVVFAETIMNPHKDLHRHCMVVVRPPFKYVSWNRVNWQAQQVEEFGPGRLFRMHDNSQMFDESTDRSAEFPETATELRGRAHETLRDNLAFLQSFPVEPY